MDFGNRVRVAIGYVTAVALVLMFAPGASAQGYKKPPQVVQDVLNAPIIPQLVMSPSMDTYILAQNLRYPPIADVAEPMLRLAGLRINPRNNAPHRTDSNTQGRNAAFVGLTIKSVGSDRETRVSLPPDARIGPPRWSPDGRRFAFLNMALDRTELWVGDAATGATRRVNDGTINAAYLDVWNWMPDSKTLVVALIRPNRGAAPSAPAVPDGPNMQETAGAAPVATFQDTLKNVLDEKLFDYYATSQLALIDVDSRRVSPIGEPSIFSEARPSPDGKFLLVGRLRRPYSYLHTHAAFPREIEIWDRAGKRLRTIASLPLADKVPVEGVRTGPRNYMWKASDAATVVWVEALDEGDPRKTVPHRDRLMRVAAPFTAEAAEIARTEQRFAGLQWIGASDLAFVEDNNRKTRIDRTFLVDLRQPGGNPQLVWSLNERERYAHPGDPVFATLPTGHRTVLQSGDFIFLAGVGASPEGDRPFLDRFNLKTLKAERLYRSSSDEYEEFVALASADGSRYVTRRESPTMPPNYVLRQSDGKATAMTSYPDPVPVLRKVKKELVTYKREDGVQLSFTLYLPPDYQPGKRLPTMVWAYPLEYNTVDTASQVSGSTKRFTTITGASHLFYALMGYAVLDDATMPVVGDPETVNNTYIEQIVMSARAAIDKAVAMGVTDRDRVGVAGHSYGGFMTANLLAHSDLFRAGVARSGAYNRTLTPFGFQSERRTLWEAPDTYLKMSPFMNAGKIKEPILFIHGEADNNTGTFPIQSERMYAAVHGNGGTARLVTLPHEAHGYIARESIEHSLHEMIEWFERWVKDAPPRAGTSEDGRK